MLRDVSGNSCAFVTFTTCDEAHSAVDSLNGMKTSIASPEFGSTIIVKLAGSDQERQIKSMQYQILSVQILAPQKMSYYNPNLVSIILQQFPNATDQQTANMIISYALQLQLSQMYNHNLASPIVNTSPVVTPQA